MQYYDWQQYLATLDKKMKQMEKQVQQLEDQVQTIQDKPSTNIERIEYKFDQLKIETLEGTLNIGLSPEGLSSTEDLAIPEPQQQTKKTNTEQPLVRDIMQQLQPFINQELPSKVNQFAERSENSFPPGFEKMIIQDVYRQLPDRIHYYIRLHAENQNGLLNNQMKEQIIEDVKHEMLHSIKRFINGNEDKGGTS
ncbi:spore germination protein PC [Salinibacillus kushneri]|uniref:Spore germination protein PC n=1 Tax=Salinibacillus kushneri TaxID=237682 RepID=A0A1I0J492_9BACI|nr:spore germination protein GerPC [Salinibacillus kushneri]SEU03829.1 spore germination protein PC [Salinibacillus kushneri]